MLRSTSSIPITESELKACRLAWATFKVPSRTNNGPELMDDGVRYLRLGIDAVDSSTLQKVMLFKAGQVLSANLPQGVFEVSVLSFGLCWEKMK